MKLLFVILISYLCITTLLHATEPPSSMQLLSPKETLRELDNIKSKAIVFGNGPKEIHTFIDPYCELSQRYLSFLFEKREIMFKKYTIYLYLYELKGKNSKEAINTIYASELKNTMLESIMVHKNDIILETFDEEADLSTQEVAKAAQRIGVFKRPYIIINGKVK